MTQISQAQKRGRILDFLRRVTRFSTIELGSSYTKDGSVVECSRAGTTIRGVITLREGQQDFASAAGAENTFSTSLNVISNDSITATCSCSTLEEMQEQWCAHAVALLLRSEELGFLQHDSGFAADESTVRMNLCSPDEIASVIADISRITPAATSPGALRQYTPNVTVIIDHSSDRLGVQVQFDGEVQEPAIFEDNAKRSSRTLDNLLLSLLEEQNAWDSAQQQWFVNSSREIELVLGMVREYRDVISKANGRPIVFADSLLDARLNIEWTSTGAELSIEWKLPNGVTQFKQEELLGNGPYWTIIGNTVYRLTKIATQIASIFPRTSELNLTRSQIGPVLSALTANLVDHNVICVRNPEEQPKSKIVSPTPLLTIERVERGNEHFTSSSSIELVAELSFEYPRPASGAKVVYLPDKKQESEYLEFLKSLGFKSTLQRNQFTIGGDAALELIHPAHPLFPAPWQVSGIETIRGSLRFVDLKVNIALNSGDTVGAKPNSKPAKGSKKGKSEQVADRIDWFDCFVSLSQNNANVPLSSLFKNIKGDQDRWVRLDNGAYAKIPGGGAQQLKTTLGLLDPNFRLTNNIRSRLGTAQALSFCRLEESGLDISLDQTLQGLRKKLQDFTSIAPVKVGSQFKGKLRSYQKEGLAWLNFLREFRLSGILADEMGLGKTVQALSLLQHLSEQTQKQSRPTKLATKKAVKNLEPDSTAERLPSLVVAPTSVVMNWVYEAKRFTPNLKVLLLHGPGRKQHFSEIENYDIVITSYALIRIDRLELERHQFNYLILDEAQNIKNPQASTTKAAKAMRARQRLAMTGTPTENRPLELWSIFDFLMPGYLGNMEFFRANIERPIIDTQAAAQVTKFLNSKTRPFIMRRLKRDVEKELPAKIESDLHVVMTESQRQLYNQIVAEVRPRVFDAVSKKGVRGASVSILAALLRLRQVCNHPNSIEALRGEEGYDSGKFDLLQELLEEALEGGRKILLFSQFKEMLAIIRRWVEQRGTNYLYLDGATRNRQELIDQFTYDDKVRLFLISLKAGGTGLNLAAADTVILYDPWWNPAVESQAIDRAHRIGQTKTVSVYRLITENSIEQKIMDLKARKSKIVDALVNDNGLSTLSLSKTDLESLFAPVEEGAGS